MMNIDKVLAHRGLILTALKHFKKKVELVQKGEVDIEVDTDGTERQLESLDVLMEEFRDQRALLLEGTPMGEVMANEQYTADDGASLRAGPLDDALRLVDIDAPFSFITGWSIEQRKNVHEWAKAAKLAKEHGIAPPALIDEISQTWKTDTDALLQRDLSEVEIERWMLQGPWCVRLEPDKSPGLAEWEVVLPAREIHTGSGLDAQTTLSDEIVRPQRWALIDRARLVASNLNAIEAGRQFALGAAGAAAAHSNAAVVDAEESGAAPAKKRRRKKGEPETVAQAAAGVIGDADAAAASAFANAGEGPDGLSATDDEAAAKEHAE